MEIIKGIYNKIIPQKINIILGIIDNKATLTESFNLSYNIQHIIYINTRIKDTVIYIINVFPVKLLKYVYGIFTIIKTIDEYLPICSNNTTNLFL